MTHRWIVLLFAFALAGPVLAQQEGEDADEAATVAPKTAKLPAQELSSQWLYQFLIAEIAGARGHIGLSIDAYRDLARTTRDPRVAQRAAQIAVFARRLDVALEMARLWAELDAESPQAKQLVTTLLSASLRPEDLSQHLSRQLSADGINLSVALLQLNRALARIQDKRQVLRIVEQVTTPYLGMAEAHFARAVAAFGAQDSVRALAETERALALRSDWEQAALLRAQLQPRGEAIEGLRLFAREHPASHDLRLMLARLYFGEKRYAEARKEFRELLAAKPDDGDTIYAVAVLSYQLGEITEAERNFQRLVELNYPEINSVRLYLGQIAEDAKHWDEAIKLYGEIDGGEQFIAARLRQAGVLAREGKIDAGLQHLRDTRRGSGQGSEGDNEYKLLIGEAQILREAGRGAEALAALDEGLAHHPDQPDLLYESALIAERIGRLDVLDGRLKRLLQLKPDHAHAYNALGYSLLERNGDLEEAQRLIDKAVALSPDDPFILDSKGWVLFRRGNMAGALDALQKAFAIRADPEIAAHLGEVLWAMGRKDEAKSTWRKGAEASPANDVLSATVKRLDR